MKSIIQVCILATGVFAHSSFASILGTYSFTGADDGQLSGFDVEGPPSNLNFSQLSSSFSSVGVVSNFIAPNGAFGVEPYASYSFDGKGYAVPYSQIGVGSNPGLSGSPSTAASNHFLEFSVSAAQGYILTIDSISLDFGTDFATSFSPSVYYNLFYSVDATNWYMIGNASEALSNSNVYRIRDDVAKSFVQNANAPFQGSEEETAHFRLVFGLGGASGVNTKRLFVDDINIMGNVAPIPEPSTMALLFGAFAFSMVIVRRKFFSK